MAAAEAAALTTGAVLLSRHRMTGRRLIAATAVITALHPSTTRWCLERWP